MTESLRDQIGRIISDHLAEGIDICNSNDIDIFADDVLRTIRTGVMREAALLVEQAIGEVDDIFDARPQTYADPDEHSFNARRKMTMKDAKPKAKRAANYLRQAWDILDPRIK